MFKIAATPTFRHKVEVLVPVDGGHRREHFRATFRVLPTDEAALHDLGTAEGSTGFLRAILVSMDDLIGADDQPLPYSDQVRDELLQVPFVRAALVRTYLAAIQKAAEGN